MAKGRLSGILESLFGGKAKGAAGSGGDRPARSAEPAYQPGRDVEEGEVLREDVGLYGKVYILSLAEFYEAIGGRTGRLAESLLTVCDTVFGAHTGDHDGFSLVGDDKYVFRFGGLDDRQSLLRAAKIIEEIGTKMLGEHFIKSGRFKAMLTAVGLADIIDAEGNVDHALLDRAVEMSRNLPAEPAAPDEPKWVHLNYAGLTDGDKWTAVPFRRKDDIQWVSLDHKPKKKEIQWEVLKPEKKKEDAMRWEVLKPEKKKDDGVKWEVLKPEKKKDDGVKWEVLEHKKKDRELLRGAVKAEAPGERRAVVVQGGAREYRERRRTFDRRLRQEAFLGHLDRRSHRERRGLADRRRH